MRPTSAPGVTSSTLSTTRPLRPTTRPLRTKNTCTAPRPFDLQRVGRLVHLLLEPVEHRGVVSVEELEQIGDEVVVVLALHGADARRDALLDVGVEAWGAGPGG